MVGADFSTDHRKILSKIFLSVRPKSRTIVSRKKVNCALLHSARHREAYIETMKTKLQNMGGSNMEDLDHKWSQISDALRSSCLMP